MADQIQLQAELRERTGKGGARAARRAGRIPGVIYGDGKAPQAVTLDYKTISLAVASGQFTSQTCLIEMDGTTTLAIPRDVQLHPVRDFPLHVDFLRLGKDSEVTVEVPVRVLNEEQSPGLKRGGALNMVRHDIELICPASDIPEAIEIDLTGMEIGDSIHISEVTLPKGSRPAIDGDFTVLTITGASSEEATSTEGGDEEETGETSE